MISLRPPTEADREFLFWLRNDPVVMAAGRTGLHMPREVFGRQFARAVAGEILWHIVEVDGAPAGYLRLTLPPIELSIALHEDWRHRGIGPEAIRRGVALAATHWPGEPVTAAVLADNAGSLRAFEKAGFTVGQRTDRLVLLRSA